MVGLPVSFLLVGMIYSSAKALQFLTVPVYTIFKNLAIIVTAYGEHLIFGTDVSATILLSFGFMVLSSVVAAWADIQAAIDGMHGNDTSKAVSVRGVGYAWMAINVFCTSAFLLRMRRSMKSLGFRDIDSMSLMPPPLLPLELVFSFSFQNHLPGIDT